MENKHTSGEWMACTVVGTDNFSVRTEKRPGLVIIPVNKTFVNESIHDILTKEAEANALLIAASPELLKAAQECQNLSDRCNNAMLPQSVQDLLKAINETLTTAINKAIGD